jgi:hypothetical protein
MSARIEDKYWPLVRRRERRDFDLFIDRPDANIVSRQLRRVLLGRRN